MATSSIQKPLLQTRKEATSSCKTLYFVISLAAIISSAAVVFSLIETTSHSDFIVPPHICKRAHDPSSCLAMVTESVPDSATRLSHVDLLQIFLNSSLSHIGDAIETARTVKARINDLHEQAALADCVELLDLSVDRVMDSEAAIGARSPRSDADAHTWLSSVLTNHVTCLDGLKGSARSAMEAKVEDLIAKARTSLAILSEIPGPNSEVLGFRNRELPSWVTSKDRKLLEALPKDIKANVVVAKDGSGTYRTVKEAVASAPDKGKTRYVIYVKKGVYKENVEVGKKKKDVMIVGDGMDATIITGSLNVVDGSTTFRSATVAAVGDGFIAQDIWFQNTAGPQKDQAVALRVGADRSVINRCRIDAYQDTLYPHSNRQFYRDCSVTGTVDFIFGNAAVVLQNCKIIARKPLKKQKNMVTAQGRTDRNQKTGTSIQNCEIIPSADLAPVTSSFPTYLGRPWKNFSRTVVMESYIEDHIDPAGWAPWNESYPFINTLYYGEYLNRGPGANTTGRVKWKGFHNITDPNEARKFTVGELIQGGLWLPSTGVTFSEGLVSEGM